MCVPVSLSVSLSRYRTRRTKRWQPTCSWIWYEYENIHLHHWATLCCSESCLLSLRCSVALPSNGLVTFYNHKLFLALSLLFSDSLFHFCPSLSLIRIQDGLSVCDSGVWVCVYISGVLMTYQRQEKLGCRWQRHGGTVVMISPRLLHHAC